MSESASAASSVRIAAGRLFWNCSRTLWALWCASCALSWCQIVLSAAATSARLVCGTFSSTFLMTCTVQRCQAACGRKSWTAALSPWQASLITSRTPLRPRAINSRSRPRQLSSDSRKPATHASTSRKPSSLTPIATSTLTLSLAPPQRTLTLIPSR